MTIPVTSPPAGSPLEKNRRILVVDDNEAIHADFRKILQSDTDAMAFDAEIADVFGKAAAAPPQASFEMDFALQGEEALRRVQAAVAADRRYAVVFMDVRMPPGWDGVATSLKLWDVDPDLQVVICTAYVDYSWDEIMQMVKNPERLLILKKPFDTIEVLQFAHALTEKWTLLQASRQTKEALEHAVSARTHELQSAMERIRQQAVLIEKARDAIIVSDINDTILFWNRGAEDLYGWTSAEAIGQNALALFYSDPDDECFRQADEATSENGSWIGELSHITKDGRAVTVESHWTLMRDDQGRPKSVLAINSDITDKKRIESQLLRAQRLDSIGALASGVAHDLNNLLTPSLLGFELLRANGSGDGNEELLNAMATSVQRATEIVQQVLFFARGIESTRVEVELKCIIREVEKIVAETFPKSISFRTKGVEKSWVVKADPTQTHQVLINLCVNARDAMPAGGELKISTTNMEIDANYAASIGGIEPGPFVLIKVSDTGSGIPSELVDKIFEPFFTKKELGKGTGLGLSTVFGIVKNHNGAITVQSAPGVGTTFELYLPALPQASTSATKPSKAGPPRGNGELILIVDDEPSILAAIKQTLEAHGYRVLTALDGPEAIVHAAHCGADVRLVVTDMMMPAMDGKATIRVLAKLAPHLYFVGITGDKAKYNEVEMCTSGAHKLLYKPFTSNELLQAIHEALRNE